MTRPLAFLPAACAVLTVLCLTPASARADEEPPAHIAVVDGSAVVEHEASAEPAVPNVPLVPGDRVRTDRGRVEILFSDGVVLQMDEQTTVDLQDQGLARLLSGRIALISLRDRGDLQLDTPAGSVRIGPGVDARVSLVDASGREAMEVAVMRGEAQVWTDQGSTLVNAGYRVLAALGETPSQASPFNSAVWTDFDRWSQDRLAAHRASVSYQYVPSTLQAYGGVFDTYGTWGYEPVYGGYVWYPRVSVGWRPYWDGRWRFYSRFGWTWVGGAVWNWPTHHYGRWGLSRAGRWFWSPGPRWAPAYVQWAVAPGYVSWCPLGFNNRPVVPFWERRAVPRAGIWHAWTVLPRRAFDRAQFVRSAAIDGSQLVARSASPAFVTRETAPAPVAMPRATVAGRALTPGGRSAVGAAVPRSGGYITSQGRTMTVPSAANRAPAADTPRSRGRAALRAGVPDTSAEPPSSSSRGGLTVRRRGLESGGNVGSRDPRLDRPAVDPRAIPANPGYRAERAVPRTTVPRTDAPSGRPVTPAAPSTAAPRPNARRGWSPDQVPVHRGTPPPTAAPPAYGRAPAGGAVAVPRGYSVPDRSVSPRGMPMPSPPSRVSPPPTTRTAPPAPGVRSAPPSPGIRTAPAGGGRGYAVPRGPAAPPPAQAPPPASAPPHARSGRSR